MSDWKKIGTFAVDAGLCWIGDPCYLSEGKAPMHDWTDFLNWLWEKRGNKKFAQHDDGICVSTGYGDGTYSVYAKERDNCISEVRIIFIGEPGAECEECGETVEKGERFCCDFCEDEYYYEDPED